MRVLRILLGTFLGQLPPVRIKGRRLSNGAESFVWQLASECYGAGLNEHLTAAIKSFKRPPGLDSLTRVYARDIGQHGLHRLIDVLEREAKGRFHVEHGGVEIRLGLRSHLLWFLRQALMEDGVAPVWLIDDHFAGDLGL